MEHLEPRLSALGDIPLLRSRWQSRIIEPVCSLLEQETTKSVRPHSQRPPRALSLWYNCEDITPSMWLKDKQLLILFRILCGLQESSISEEYQRRTQGLTERWHNNPICCFKVTGTPKRCHLWNYMAQNCESLSQVKRKCLQQGTLEIRLGPSVFLSWKGKERESIWGQWAGSLAVRQGQRTSSCV